MTRPLRIVITTESYLPYVSGVTVSTEALARGLGARGHDVLLLAPRPADGTEPPSAGASGPAPDYAWLPSYQLPRVVPPGYRMPWPQPWPAAIRRAVAFRPDVVHAQSPFVTGLLAQRLAARLRIPLVFTHHTRFVDYRHYLGPLGGASAALIDGYLRRFWRGCAAVVAPSSDLADEIRAKLGSRRRPLVRSIATGLDTTAIAALPPRDPRLEAGWEADTVVAATLGRLAPEKRVDLVLEAVAHAAPSQPRLRLMLVGDGPSSEALARRAGGSDLRGRVWFAGSRSRPEALSLLRGADLFAFASQSETQGLVLAEALATGLPAVALSGPGVTDSVRSGIDGKVIAREPGREAVALGDAIAELAGDTEMRLGMAERAAADAGRFDTVARMAELEELYAAARREF